MNNDKKKKKKNIKKKKKEINNKDIENILEEDEDLTNSNQNYTAIGGCTFGC